MSELALQTFGYPELRTDGHAGKLALRRALALLIFMAESKGPIAREMAAALLWPETDSETARTRLRRLLHRIEESVGRPVIDADRIALRYRADCNVRLDSAAFECACDGGDFEAACRIYSGDFLSGFHLDSRAFDDWAFYRREALRGRLINALERLVLAKSAAGAYGTAAEFAGRLVELDPLSEVYARHLIRCLLRAGDRDGAERHYAALEQRLHDDLGISPEPETQALLHAFEPTAAVPEATRYAQGGGVHIAYQAHGNSGPDILVMPGFVSSVERLWELPACRSFLASVMTMGRLIIFDPRGIGLSDRALPPSPDATVEDIGTVLRATKSRQVVLFAASQCGAACIEFAVKYPGQVAGLILFGVSAKGCRADDYPIALTAEQFDTWRRQLISGWGGPIGIEAFAPSLARDAQARAWWAGLLRSASSPGAMKAVLDTVRDVDVRSLLPRVSVPTLVLHRSGDRAVRINAGQYIADRIRGAQFIELDGADHWFFAGEQTRVRDAIRTFISHLKTRPRRQPPRHALDA